MTFQDVARDVFKFYRARDYVAALKVAADGRSSHPEEDKTITFWEGCLLARRGHGDEAVETFLNGIDRGLWWPTGMLVDADLDSVRDHPDWKTIQNHCETMTEPLRAQRPLPLMRTGTGAGTIITIQGAHAMHEEFFTTWDEASPERWTVITPVAPEPTGDGRWEWPHSEEASVLNVLRDLEDFELSPPLVLTGFSAGSAIACHIIETRGLQVDGLISVAPWTRRGFDELGEASDAVPTLVICGADDAVISIEQLLAMIGGLAGVELQMVDGLGHAHPEDLGVRIAAFLTQFDSGAA